MACLAWLYFFVKKFLIFSVFKNHHYLAAAKIYYLLTTQTRLRSQGQILVKGCIKIFFKSQRQYGYDRRCWFYREVVILTLRLEEDKGG